MIVGQFTKQPSRQEEYKYNIELDPKKDLNHYGRRLIMQYQQRIRRTWMRKLSKTGVLHLLCPRCRLPFLSLRAGNVKVGRCQCKVARPRRRDMDPLE